MYGLRVYRIEIRRLGQKMEATCSGFEGDEDGEGGCWLDKEVAMSLCQQISGNHPRLLYKMIEGAPNWTDALDDKDYQPFPGKEILLYGKKLTVWNMDHPMAQMIATPWRLLIGTPKRAMNLSFSEVARLTLPTNLLVECRVVGDGKKVVAESGFLSRNSHLQDVIAPDEIRIHGV